MKREVIILSDLDLKLMDFVKLEKNMSEISVQFNISHSQIKKHFDRIKKINAVDIRRYGNFINIKLNEKGKSILDIINL